MMEPFAESDSWLCRRSGYYAVHGADQIAASPLRYCAAEQFFKLDGDDPWENTKGLLTYLGLWTRYPRIEQLAKAGCKKIIDDAIQGSMNSRALNWRAKTMPAFFGVDEPTVKRLLAGGIGQKELEALELVRHGGVTPEEAPKRYCAPRGPIQLANILQTLHLPFARYIFRRYLTQLEPFCF